MSHTHGPGETHNHSHGPPQPAPQPSVDPTLQALIDADYIPTPVVLSQDNNFALCAPHKLEKCTDCGVDYVNLNRLSKILVGNPTLLCPPPSNVISQKLTQMVTQTKDEGNVRAFVYISLYGGLFVYCRLSSRRGTMSTP